MGRKKTSGEPARKPRSFNGLLKGHTKPVCDLANAIRDIIDAELPEAQESFYGGRHAMAMYRTDADICWLQPLKQRCNLYFLRGPELTDKEGILEGASRRNRHVKIKSLDHLEQLPIREWLRESVALNDEAVESGMTFDEVLEALREICLALPHTKETETWGKPHFRVGEKIFCGCGEQQGSPRIGLKMEPDEAKVMMTAPGIVKAPYSRPNDGWVQIDPSTFDDWEEITRFVIGSFRLVAPKRIASQLE